VKDLTAATAPTTAALGNRFADAGNSGASKELWSPTIQRQHLQPSEHQHQYQGGHTRRYALHAALDNITGKISAEAGAAETAKAAETTR